jgi:hypothetical protein
MVGRSRDACRGESLVMASGVPQKGGGADGLKEKTAQQISTGMSGFEPAVSRILIATVTELHVSVWEGGVLTHLALNVKVLCSATEHLDNPVWQDQEELVPRNSLTKCVAIPCSWSNDLIKLVPCKTRLHWSCDIVCMYYLWKSQTMSSRK